MALRPNAGYDFLINGVSRSHTTTHHTREDSSGRVISSSQRLLPENTQYSQETDIHACGGIRTHNPSRRAAADPCLRPRGHWDCRILLVEKKTIYLCDILSGATDVQNKKKISWTCPYTHAMYRQQNIDFVLVYLPFFRMFNIRCGSFHRSLGCNTSEHYAVLLRNRYLKVTPIQLLILWPLIIDTVKLHLHLTYLLTPWSRAPLEKLTGSAASQEILRIFETRRFLTVPTSARHLSLS